MLNGGDGVDRADYGQAETGITVDLANAGSNTGEAADDTLIGIENLLGSFFNDRLNGDAADNTLWGGDGDDILSGRAGDDVLHAGAGTGTGLQHLVGGTGSDTYVVQANSGQIRTDAQAWGEVANASDVDTILFSDISIADVIFSTQAQPGTPWADTLVISWNVNGVEGSYWLADLGANIERFEFADGTVLSSISVDHWGDERESYNGTAEDDRIGTPDVGWSHAYALDGNDTMLGGEGRDQLVGGLGDDVLSAGGNAYDDSFQWLYGQQGSDTYLIASGDENVFLGYNSDTEQAGEVDIVRFTDLNITDLTMGIADYTQGGTVSNPNGQALKLVWNGGQLRIANLAENIERFVFADGSTLDRTTFGDAAANGLTGNASNDFLMGLGGNDSISGDLGDDLINGGTGSDSLRGMDNNDTLYGEAGADTLRGGNNEDELYGGDGNDSMTGDSGYDTLNGGAGNDQLDGGAQNDTLYGGSGDDRLWGRDGNDVLLGDTGRDTLYGGTGDDSLRGLDNNDTLWGEAGADTLRGGNNEDELYGGDGNDSMTGDSGYDTLNGGAGGDSLHGGTQADEFHFAGGFGNDTIVDFDVANTSEYIDLSGVGAIISFTDLQVSHMTQSGSHTIINDGNGNTITLENVSLTSLTAGDFIFV